VEHKEHKDHKPVGQSSRASFCLLAPLSQKTTVNILNLAWAKPMLPSRRQKKWAFASSMLSNRKQETIEASSKQYET